MTKNEIVARWMCITIIPTSEGTKYILFKGHGPYMINQLMYNSSYDWLMPAWVKFRDLKFDYKTDKKLLEVHDLYCSSIKSAYFYLSITEAFDELVKGIEWYNSLKK